MNIFLYLGIFSTSASILMFEVISTRISRLAFGYDYKFIILSLAALGIGIGGMATYFLLEKINRNKNIFLLTVALCYLFASPIPFVLAHYNSIFDLLWLKIAFFFLAFFLYFFAGLLFSFVFAFQPLVVSIIYFWDLVGGAIGTILAVFLLDALGNSNTISYFLLVSTLPYIFLVIYTNNGKKFRYISISLVVLFAVIFMRSEIFKIQCAKFAPEYSYSNSFSQIDAYYVKPQLAVIKESSRQKVDIPPSVTAIRMEIDCLATTHLINYNNLSDAIFIQNEMAGMPFAFKPNSEDVLIIGSGAGMDVIRALQYQEKNITAVEINPLILELYKKYVGKNSDVYAEKNVQLIVDDGRKFIETSDKKYDIIALPSSFKYGKSGLSFYGFIENYLFTKEAFRTYLNNLKDGGILALVNRNSGGSNGHLNTAIAALQDNAPSIENRIVFIGGKKSSLLIVKNGVFSQEERKKVSERALFLGFSKPVFPQGKTLSPEIIDNAATKDERPYPLNHEGVGSFSTFLHNLKNNFLLSFLVFVLALIFCLFFTPGTRNNISRKHILYLSCYFSALGAGFMILELSLIQRLTMFIGNPSYSLATILATILLFGGFGSILVRYFNLIKDKNNISKIIVCAISIMIIYLFLFKPLFPLILHYNLFIRISSVIVLVALPSLLLGALFPIGIGLINKRHLNLVPLMWGLDGISAVWGGIGGTILYALYGFQVALLSCIILYFIVLLSAIFMPNPED